MCGRFSIISNPEQVAQLFNATLPLEGIPVRYNAAPTQLLPVITNREARQIQLFQWGLIPSWAKDPKIGNKMINARAETLSEKPSFRSLLKNKRCLILADGFYEWKKTPAGKVPMRITLKQCQPFAFAGLWDVWKTPEEKLLHTFTIITTQANQLISNIHDRMPVILNKESVPIWLDDSQPQQTLLSVLSSFPTDDMDVYPIDPRINSPAFDDPSLIQTVNK